MIAASHFTRLADRHDVDAKTVERDYVLTHVVAGIGQQPGSEHMAFKGGTALRLCYFEDYRYSADLDFSLTGGMTRADAATLVAGALEAIVSAHGFAYLAVGGEGDRIEYTGPLRRQRHVKLDLAVDELVEDTARMPLLTRYDDQPGSQIVAYTLQEAAAEKLRCVIQRVQARDLYDLHELFVERGLLADDIWPAFERKTTHKNLDPQRFADMFAKRMPAWSRRWDTEMEDHVPADVRPAFNAVERAVTRALRPRLRSGRNPSGGSGGRPGRET